MLDVEVPEINLDFIAGLKGQTKESFLDDLNLAVSLEPTMIHTYPLTETGATTGVSVDSGSRERIRELLKIGIGFLEKSGFKMIRNDGFGRSESSRNVQETDVFRYNSNVLGIGSGSQSHSFSGYSYITKPRLKDYMKSISDNKPYYSGIKMNIDYEKRWFVLHNINDGIVLDDYRSIFGSDLLDDFSAELTFLSKQGLVDINDSRIIRKANGKGVFLRAVELFYNDEVMELLLKKASKRN